MDNLLRRTLASGGPDCDVRHVPVFRVTDLHTPVSDPTARGGGLGYIPGMRAFGGIALAAVVSLLSPEVAAKPVGERRLGVGVGFGEPTAVTGYYSLGRRFAVDAALGMQSFEAHHLAGHSDVLALFGGDSARHTAGAFYVGLGLFFVRFYDDVFAGMRFPLGVAIFIPDARLQIFGEVSMQILVASPYETPRNEDFQAAVGIRFFF